MAECQAEPVKSYSGNCHCGAFRFELNLPEIKSVGECNCSICTKKGYLWLFPTRDAFTVTKGTETELTTYIFGEGKLHHKFCPKCGTAIIATMPDGPPNFNLGLNAHAIQGLDTWSLERNSIDGAALGSSYEAPIYTGSQPTLELDGGKMYNGSCHCGAVQIALISKPIDASFSELISQCNCSICERNAYVWIYPRREQVVLHGEPKDIGRYYFASQLFGKTFCKRCGVQLTNEPVSLSQGEVAALSEDHRGFYGRVHPFHPVNLRALEGVDIGSLKEKITQLRGADRPPKYVLS